MPNFLVGAWNPRPHGVQPVLPWPSSECVYYVHGFLAAVSTALSWSLDLVLEACTGPVPGQFSQTSSTLFGSARGVL
eukprot:5840267-Pyramimonas_sp.AAC.1